MEEGESERWVKSGGGGVRWDWKGDWICSHLTILEWLVTATAELIRTPGTFEVDATTSGQFIAHVTLWTLYMENKRQEY